MDIKALSSFHSYIYELSTASILKELALTMTSSVIKIALKLFRVDKGVITDARFVYASNKIPSDVYFVVIKSIHRTPVGIFLF